MADHDEDRVNLALLAHDLRTPLGAMRLTAELIGSGPLNTAQADQLSVLMRSIDALDQMATELIADAAPGDAQTEAAVKISAIVADCVDLFRVAARNKGLDLDVHLQQTAAGCRLASAGRLRRVLAALLDNAIKYTGSGRIDLEVVSCPPPTGKSDDDSRFWVCVSVVDTGPGISREERDSLFRPFVRGAKSDAVVPGSGLGLWGAAQTVRSLGGLLDHSAPEGGGSRFELRLPVMPPERASAAASPQEKPEQDDNGLPEHVLIVDDNETNCRLLAALLESFGVSADIAHTGEQAIGYAQQQDYGAVLLDLHMPGMSGLEVARELHTIRPAEQLPLIAVTAALEAFGDKLLRKAGFLDGLGKPLSPTALHEVLKKAQRIRSVHWI